MCLSFVTVKILSLLKAGSLSSLAVSLEYRNQTVSSESGCWDTQIGELPIKPPLCAFVMWE